ncbi:MAG: LLM class flavin-dependent oxidoreductase, partial [Balneolales bacterium]|nr:LLM class flavin-dependent oxidoreductase [Balneolales bacterium]
MDIELFTTSPQSVNSDRQHYMMEVQRVSKETEKFGFKGMLVYSDNRLADAWVVTSIILAETTHILPMIALQPVYMHPYTVAKKIATIGLVYNRQIALNLIAGGFTQDLSAMGDHTPHDRRYNRLAEYTEIIRLLLTNPGGVTYKGEYYDIRNLKLQPELPEELQPKYYLSGSSDMARATAKRLDATLIE